MSTVVAVVLLAVVVLALTPLPFPRSPGDAAGRYLATAQGVPLIYWRPGCTFCVRMRLALGRRGGRAVWVNISGDPAAAQRVRSVNSGNETVPTVFVGEESRTNPSPTWVRERLRAG